MKKEFIPVLRFVASSDAHIEGAHSVGYTRLKKAIDFSLNFAKKDERYKKLDVILMAGDFTDHGRPDEFDAFGQIFNYAQEKGTPLLSIVARGHECITLKKKSLDYFRKTTDQETDFHRILAVRWLKQYRHLRPYTEFSFLLQYLALLVTLFPVSL